MKRELAECIVSACQNNEVLFANKGEELPTLKEAYKGRSMGDTTTAIVVEDLVTVMAAVACELVELQEDWDYQLDLSKLANLQTDSLGRSSTVIY